jgi:hypothetical protein
LSHFTLSILKTLRDVEHQLKKFKIYYVLVQKHNSLTLAERHELRFVQNRMPRKIFGPMDDEPTGWRKLHVAIHGIYCANGGSEARDV